MICMSRQATRGGAASLQIALPQIEVKKRTDSIHPGQMVYTVYSSAKISH
jgi:hypothetical protein